MAAALEDWLASVHTQEENAYALQQIERVLKGDTTPSTELDLDGLIAAATAG